MSSPTISPKRKLSDVSDGTEALNGSPSPKAVRRSQDQDCASAKHQLEVKISALEDDIRRLEDEKKALERMCESYRDVLDDKAAQAASLKRKNAELQDSLAKVDKSRREAIEDIAELIRERQMIEEQSSALDTETEILREQDRQTTRALARQIQELQDTYPGSPAMVFPPKIQKEWAKLTAQIEEFVKTHLPLSFPSSHPPIEHHFHHLTKTPADFLYDPTLCAHLCQAWVWRHLHTSILAPSAAFWAGDLGVSFAAQCKAILAAAQGDDKQLRRYYSWRSQGANLLLAAAPAGDRAAETGRLGGEIFAFVFATLGCELTRPARAVMDEIKAFVTTAGNLDRLLRRAKAVYTVAYPAAAAAAADDDDEDDEDDDRVCWFDPATMRLHGAEQVAESARARRAVLLAVSPAVFKRGSVDGKRYQEETVLIRHEVVCGEPETGPLVEEGQDGDVDVDETEDGSEEETEDEEQSGGEDDDEDAEETDDELSSSEGEEPEE